MLNQHDIEALLAWRILRCSESCNSGHVMHVGGQIRALAAVLRDGVPCRADDIVVILTHTGIPFTLNVDGDGVEWDGPWMIAHGFILDENADTYGHPRFEATEW